MGDHLLELPCRPCGGRQGQPLCSLCLKADALSIACPKCGAPIGMLCKRLPQANSRPHHVRVRTAALSFSQESPAGRTAPVTNTVGAGATDALLYAVRAIRDKLALIPPPPIFASTSTYPGEQFLMFTDQGQQYIIGHPGLWKSIPARCNPFKSMSEPLFTMSGIPIIDLDAEGDTPRGRAIYDAMRRVTNALLGDVCQ